ncbi:hypothetical protein [Synechococcus elongatus]|uniref:hypothetical protein n=1 Tax=Synechococcus elongatus TaxID=32046 RepID=UPI000F7D6B17|nr:hypothetical protein [Synechococcus elongatus]
MSEETPLWFPINQIPGFAECIEYYVSQEGEVMSFKKSRYGQKLKKRFGKFGSPGVWIMNRLGNRRPRYATLSHLVAQAFLGPPPRPLGRGNGFCSVTYKDGDISNVHVSNLEYRINGEKNAKPSL